MGIWFQIGISSRLERSIHLGQACETSTCLKIICRVTFWPGLCLHHILKTQNMPRFYSKSQSCSRRIFFPAKLKGLFRFMDHNFSVLEESCF